MSSEHDELVAAILVLGMNRGNGPRSAVDLVKNFQAVRDEIQRMRDAHSQQEMEAWNRHAHLETD